MVEGEQALLGERVKELNDEERIAGRLLVHQLRQRRGVLRLAAKRIRDQLPHMLTGQRRQGDLLQRTPAWRIASSLRISGCAASTSLSR